MEKENEEEINKNLMDQVLDMPPPWFPSLTIDRDNFARLYPCGVKSTI